MRVMTTVLVAVMATYGMVVPKVNADWNCTTAGGTEICIESWKYEGDLGGPLNFIEPAPDWEYKDDHVPPFGAWGYGPVPTTSSAPLVNDFAIRLEACKTMTGAEGIKCATDLLN